MLFALLLAAPQPVQMQPPPPGLRHEPPFLRHGAELGLTEAQRTQLRGILEARNPTLQVLGQAFHEAQRALMEHVRGAAAGDLTALNQAFANAHLALMTEVRALHQACLAVLMPDQRAKALAMRPMPPVGPEGSHRPPLGGQRRPQGPGEGEGEDRGHRPPPGRESR